MKGLGNEYDTEAENRKLSKRKKRFFERTINGLLYEKDPQ
jgi:hypothetical protein